MILMCLPQLWVSLRARLSWPVRTIIAIAMFPAAGLFVALWYGWADGYWNQ
jgi:hypothetical protein